jgi:hypothetical protein
VLVPEGRIGCRQRPNRRAPEPRDTPGVSFDHLVGTCEEGFWDSDSNRFGNLEIDQ